MRRILVIDGMYFANRALFGMQAENPSLTLDSEQEQHNFLTYLNNSFLSLILAYNNESHHLIDNVIFCSDFGSWRKDAEPFIPKYYRDMQKNSVKTEFVPPLKYKENRVEKKEKSGINYTNFYAIVHLFVNELDKKYPTLKIAGCEGDDLIYLLSKTFQGTNYEMLVFCTDGDLMQVVNENCIVFRNTKSKECPYGEFVMTQNRLNEYFGNRVSNPELKLLGSNIEDSFQTLLKMQLYSTTQVMRDVDKGLSVAKPNLMLLKKCICGDAKDNIFPLLRKPKDENRSRNSNVSDKQLIDSLTSTYGKVDENVCTKIFENEEERENLFVQLRSLCKMDDYPLDEMERHFKHNAKMNVLSINNLERRIVDEFKEKLRNIVPRLKEIINMEEVGEQMKTQRDNAVDLLKDSAPTSIL